MGGPWGDVIRVETVAIASEEQLLVLRVSSEASWKVEWACACARSSATPGVSTASELSFCSRAEGCEGEVQLG